MRVDAATVVRIVQTMGFTTYPDFQRYVHDLSIARATSLDTMKARWQHRHAHP
jgi:DNA-binding MurR/RpiR family transcriptional regulator